MVVKLGSTRSPVVSAKVATALRQLGLTADAELLDGTGLLEAPEVQSLPARAIRILELLKVKCVREFLALDEERLRSLPNVGSRTLLAIVNFQNLLRPMGQAQDQQAMPSSKRQPPWSAPFSGQAVFRLPLFSGWEARPQELHPSYCGDVPANELNLPTRATEVLSLLGIKTLGQLLCTPYGSLLGHHNFAEVSLRAAQDVVLGYLRCCNGLEEPLDMRAFELFANAVLRRCVTRQQARDVLAQRIGLKTGEAATLSQIGRPMGITREAVRVIEKKGIRELNCGRSRHLLAPFLEAVRRCLARFGGTASHIELAATVSTMLRWRKFDYPTVLARFVAACDTSYRIDPEIITNS